MGYGLAKGKLKAKELVQLTKILGVVEVLRSSALTWAFGIYRIGLWSSGLRVWVGVWGLGIASGIEFSELGLPC